MQPPGYSSLSRAAVFGTQSLGLEIGSAVRMGPGFFPLLLAVVLILLGFLILANAFRTPGEDIGNGRLARHDVHPAAPIFFGLTVRGWGFVPSIFLTTLVAAMASMKMKAGAALVLAAGVSLCSARWSSAMRLGALPAVRPLAAVLRAAGWISSLEPRARLLDGRLARKNCCSA